MKDSYIVAIVCLCVTMLIISAWSNHFSSTLAWAVATAIWVRNLLD